MKNRVFILTAAVMLLGTAPGYGQKWLQKIGNAIEKATDAVEQATGNDSAARQQREREAQQQQRRLEFEQQEKARQEELQRRQAEADAQKAELQKLRGIDEIDMTRWDSYPDGQRFSITAFSNKKLISPDIAGAMCVYTVEEDPWNLHYTPMLNGECWITTKTGWIGINSQGERISDYVSPFRFNEDGVALATAYASNGVIDKIYGGTVYLIDKTGKETLIPGLCGASSHFNSQGLAWVSLKQDRDVAKHGWGSRAWIFREALMNRDMKIIWTADTWTDTPVVGKTRDFSEGLTPYTAYLSQIVNEFEYRYGYIDENGKTVIPAKYKRAYDFQEGVALTQDESGKWGFIDQAGNAVIPHRYTNEPTSFSHGLALVKKTEGRAPYAYIDKTGRIVKEGFGSDIMGSNMNRLDNGLIYWHGRYNEPNVLLGTDLNVLFTFDEAYAVKLGGRLYVDKDLEPFSDEERNYLPDQYPVVGQVSKFGDNGLAWFEVSYGENRTHYSGYVRRDGGVVMLFKRSEF
jgi:hypothetical protein